MIWLAIVGCRDRSDERRLACCAAPAAAGPGADDIGVVHLDVAFQAFARVWRRRGLRSSGLRRAGLRPAGMRKFAERSREDGVTIDRADEASYEEAIAGFSRQALEAALAGDLARGLNACVECCDRHASPGRIALRWRSHDGREGSSRSANSRSARRASPMSLSRMASSLGTSWPASCRAFPISLTVILGAWRAGAVYQPLFTAFGPKAIEHRLAMSGRNSS